MLRRLYHEQPESFAFTPANSAWAEAQVSKYPEGRQASAILPLLWRAQEQEGWLSRPAIEAVADRLGMDYIRALEVATFYFMFHLHPVGSVAHFQICGTTPCMLCGAEDLVAVCREKIAPQPFEISADGKFSWEEVECLGACCNAPMAQIGKDYFEDLTPDGLAAMIDTLASGEVPVPGPQNGRFASEPKSGLTTLSAHESGRMTHNASVARALELGDTLKRIDGSEVPLTAPWREFGANHAPAPSSVVQNEKPVEAASKAPLPETTNAAKIKAAKDETASPGVAQTRAKSGAATPATGAASEAGIRPEALDAPRAGKADDLKRIRGIGPKLEVLCHKLGVFHFDQIAGWTKSEVSWVDRNLEGFRGRVSRDNWVEQAKLLAGGKETEFSPPGEKGGDD